MYDAIEIEISITTYRVFYNSLLISLYSFLERKMFELCKIAQGKQEIKIKDLSGKGIFQYHKYITKVLNIDLSELNTEWNFIKNINKIRNHIVHSPTNEVNKLETKTIQAIKNFKSKISISENANSVTFEIKDTELLKDFLKIINTFIDNIHSLRYIPSKT